MISLEGNLVTLEPLDVAKHAQGYFELSQDEKIHEYVGNSVPETPEEVEGLLNVYKTHFLNWMILDKNTRHIIGIFRLSKPEAENGSLVAGESQRLSSEYWRKGHMKETKQLLYPHIFGELGIEKLYADVWEGNVNSMKSLEFYGYRLTDVRKERFSKTGELTSNYLYTLTKEDYEHKKNILQ